MDSYFRVSKFSNINGISFNIYKYTQSRRIYAQIPKSLASDIPCNVYTGYHATREIEYGVSTSTVDNQLSKTHRLSIRTGEQTIKQTTVLIQL